MRRIRSARWWRVVFVMFMLCGAIVEQVVSPEPAHAEAAPVYGDGYCVGNGGPTLTLVTCSDEAGAFLWSIKDPAFWHMAYAGITGLYATGGLMSATYWADGDYGCSYSRPDDGLPLSGDEFIPYWQGEQDGYAACVERVEEEAFRQARLRGYDIPTTDEQDLIDLCNWFPTMNDCQGLSDSTSLSAWLFSGQNSVNRPDFAAVDEMRTKQAFLAGFRPLETTVKDEWHEFARWECNCPDADLVTRWGAVVFDWKLNTLGGLGGPVINITQRMRYYRTNPGLPDSPNGVETENFSWRGYDALYGFGWMNGTGSLTSIRDDTDSTIGTAWRATWAGTPSTHMYHATINGTFESSDSEVVRWWTGEGASLPAQAAIDSLLISMEDVTPGIVYGGANPYPWPDPETDQPPFVPPVLDPEPGPDPAPELDPSPTPGTDPEPAPDESIDGLGDRIQGLFENLGSLIGGAFDWLGDIFGKWIQWLAEQIRKLVSWLGTILQSILAVLQWLAGLLNWMLQSLLEALGAMLDGLGSLLRMVISAIQALGGLMADLFAGVVAAIASVADFLANLATGIATAIGDALYDLFVPVELTGVGYACEDVWPCSWVQEAIGFVQGVSDIAGGAGGGCVAPAVGWSEFSVSAPPPSGCSAASGTVAADSGNAGDLFGYRVAVRTVAFLSFGIWFVLLVVGMTPWAQRRADMATYGHRGEQQTLFDGFD